MQLAARLLAGFVVLTGATSMGAAQPQGAAPAAGQPAADDPYTWLETDSDRAMAWVRNENQRTLGALQADPRYQQLVRRRGRFTWTLSIVMLVAYFGYIALVAFDKSLLARPIGGGVTSLGIPVGVGLILLAILLTGLYVRRANREYDPLVRALRDGESE